MSNKQNIIREVLTQIKDSTTDEVINKIEDALVIALGDYDITEKETSLAVNDNSSISLLKRFIATKRLEGLSDKSLKRYYEQNIKLIAGIGKNLCDITTDDIRLYMSIMKYKKEKYGKILSSVTLNGMKNCYSTFFSWLTAERLITYNPCLGLHKIKCKKTIKKAFTDEEIMNIKSKCKKSRDIALIEFLSSTGCRVSEVEKLNMNDLDLDNKECIVHGKGDKDRYVYLSDKCIDALKIYLYRRNKYENECVLNKISTTALFINKNGDRLSKSGIEQLIHKIGKKCGIKAYPHKFRRTFATKMVTAGVDIQYIAKLLGHEDIKTTMIYCDICNDDVKKVYMNCWNDIHKPFTKCLQYNTN